MAYASSGCTSTFSATTTASTTATTIQRTWVFRVRWMVVAVVLAVVVALKVLVQPLLAYAIGRALGLDGRMLLAAVVTSGLPTAQNVFVYAVRYGKASWLARDAVVVSTVLTAPSLVLIALWLG